MSAMVFDYSYYYAKNNKAIRKKLKNFIGKEFKYSEIRKCFPKNLDVQLSKSKNIYFLKTKEETFYITVDKNEKILKVY